MRDDNKRRRVESCAIQNAYKSVCGGRVRDERRGVAIPFLFFNPYPFVLPFVLAAGPREFACEVRRYIIIMCARIDIYEYVYGWQNYCSTIG